MAHSHFIHPFTKLPVDVPDGFFTAHPTQHFKLWDHEEAETLQLYADLFQDRATEFSDNAFFRQNHSNILKAIEYATYTIPDRFEYSLSDDEKDKLVRQFGYLPGPKERIRNGYFFHKFETFEDLPPESRDEFYTVLTPTSVGK